MNNFNLYYNEFFDHPSNNFWLDKYLKLRKKYTKLEEINKTQKIIIDKLENNNKDENNNDNNDKDYKYVLN